MCHQALGCWGRCLLFSLKKALLPIMTALLTSSSNVTSCLENEFKHGLRVLTSICFSRPMATLRNPARSLLLPITDPPPVVQIPHFSKH